MAEVKEIKKIVLNADQLDGQLTIAYGFVNGPKADKPKNKDAEPQQYRLLVFNSIPFRVEESTFQQWQNGELFEMTLEETEYEKTFILPDATEEKRMVPAYSYSGSRTTKQVINRKSTNLKMKIIDSMDVTTLTEEKVATMQSWL